MLSLYLIHLFSPLRRDRHLLIEINNEQHWCDPSAQRLKNKKKEKEDVIKCSRQFISCTWNNLLGVQNTHFGVWISFCSFAACKQGCTTSSSLISNSRIPLFSTTRAPRSFSSFQNQTQWLVMTYVLFGLNKKSKGNAIRLELEKSLVCYLKQ